MQFVLIFYRKVLFEAIEANLQHFNDPLALVGGNRTLRSDLGIVKLRNLVLNSHEWRHRNALAYLGLAIVKLDPCFFDLLVCDAQTR